KAGLSPTGQRCRPNSLPPKNGLPTAKSAALHTGAVSGYCPTASNSGRRATVVCMTACATNARETIGHCSGSRPDGVTIQTVSYVHSPTTNAHHHVFATRAVHHTHAGRRFCPGGGL